MTTFSTYAVAEAVQHGHGPHTGQMINPPGGTIYKVRDDAYILARRVGSRQETWHYQQGWTC